MSEEQCEDPYEALRRKTAEAQGAEGGTIEFEVDGSGLRRDFEWRDPAPPENGMAEAMRIFDALRGDGAGQIVIDWREPAPPDMEKHLLAMIEMVKATRRPVTAFGVRIEPVDSHGDTDTMRRLREISEERRKREEQLGHAHEALRKARQHVDELEREREARKP